MNENMKAFLDAVAWSEGTDDGQQPTNNHGYDVIVGGGQFSDYSNHPNVFVDFPKLKITSSAAGRYQILARYYNVYKRELNLPDFSPESQDAIAMQMIKERKATDDIEAGRFDEAVLKCRSIWASLPGSTYGQHTQTMVALRDVYTASGGAVA